MNKTLVAVSLLLLSACSPSTKAVTSCEQRVIASLKNPESFKRLSYEIGATETSPASEINATIVKALSASFMRLSGSYPDSAAMAEFTESYPPGAAGDVVHARVTVEYLAENSFGGRGRSRAVCIFTAGEAGPHKSWAPGSPKDLRAVAFE